MRKVSLLVLGAFVAVTIASCSSTSTTSSGTTAAPTTAASGGGGSSTTKAGGGGGTATTRAGGTTRGTSGGASKTPITKPSNPTKVDKSKLPAKAQAADSTVSGLSEDEQQCIDYTISTVLEENPEYAADEQALAFVIGGTLVACIPQDMLSAGLAGLIAEADASITPEQTQCIQTNLGNAEPEALAVFLGGLVLKDPTILQLAGAFFNEECKTSF